MVIHWHGHITAAQFREARRMFVYRSDRNYFVSVSNYRSNQVAAKVDQVPGGVDANDDFQMVLLQKITSVTLVSLKPAAANDNDLLPRLLNAIR